MFVMVLGPTQCPIQWVLVALAPGLKQPGCDVDRSSRSSGRVKNEWSYTFMLLCMPSWCAEGHLYITHQKMKAGDGNCDILSYSPVLNCLMIVTGSDRKQCKVILATCQVFCFIFATIILKI